MVLFYWRGKMASKNRKFREKPDYDPYDDYNEDFEDDMDIEDIARDFYSTDWEGAFKTDRRMNARRKIEQRREMKRLYSQLDDFAEFGEHANW